MDATKCSRCGKGIPGRAFSIGGETLCRDCLLKKAEAGNICPCCGADVAPKESVGLLLALPDATPREKAAAPTALAIVCPRCRVLFFDEFQYTLLRSLRGSADESR